MYNDDSIFFPILIVLAAMILAVVLPTCVGVDTTQAVISGLQETTFGSYAIYFHLVDEEKIHRKVSTQPFQHDIGDTIYVHRSCMSVWYLY